MLIYRKGSLLSIYIVNEKASRGFGLSMEIFVCVRIFAVRLLEDYIVNIKLVNRINLL